MRVWGEDGREVRAVLVGRVDRVKGEGGVSVFGRLVSSLKMKGVS